MRLHVGVLLGAILTVPACLDRPSTDVDQSTRTHCGPGACEVALSHLFAASDDHEELHGAFGNAPVYVERDAGGRFFMAVRHGYAVFDSLATLITRVGGSGAGPGEFASPYLPLIGPGDSVHVFDVLQARLSIFSPDLSLARVVSEVTAPPTLIRRDGSYILAGQVRTPDRLGYPLHLMSPEGQLLRSFGADTAQYRPDIPLLTDRVIGLSADGTVWAAAPGRYLLERWNPDTGRKLDRLPVQASWFVESVRYAATWAEPPVTSIQGLWEDGGLLWVLIRVADQDWHPPEVPGEFSPTARDRSDRYDSIVEAIDSSSGEVLASQRFDNPLWIHPRSALLTSHQISDGLAFAFDVWTTRLQAKEQSR